MKYAGLVEGFYWREDDSVNGEWGSYSFDSRNELLHQMAKHGLNFYMYDPKMRREETKFNASHNWNETFAISKKLGIDFIWGIAPGEIQSPENYVKTTEHVLSKGATGIAILLDDAPGCHNPIEEKKQIALVNLIEKEFPGSVRLYCHSVYSGTPDILLNAHKNADAEMPKTVDFVFTGPHGWCREINLVDLPVYQSGRKSALWDNWIATDDSKNIISDPIRGRSPDFLKAINRYMLNPCFPASTVYPLLPGIGELLLQNLK